MPQGEDNVQEFGTPFGTTTRRGVVIGACALGAATVIAACGDTKARPASGSTASGAAGASPAQPQVLKPSDIPVGGGVILSDQDTVVTQPQADQFKAFSATCTHLGCQVERVSDSTIKCPCHGSQYSVVDGSVVHGPATKPLPAKTVTVSDGTLTIS